MVSHYGPDPLLEKRLTNDYREFCRIKRVAKEKGYQLLIGQMKRMKLGAGAIANYVKIISKGDRGEVAYKCRKATECMQTDTPSGHAMDITLQEANKAIDRAKVEEPEHALALWMLLATGARRIDVHRLKPESVKITVETQTKNKVAKHTLMLHKDDGMDKAFYSFK